ncbi:hypothetical protein GWK47_041929 [Chionoecetes opilio]|uniref:Uncharacterized protein n=1 Tax=Chionoecetes opilio TaxID=41210 RepID=A0A8J4YBW4_CHIOP|nr:hypothetical protein GWK47_041929 [Chionoecetes opilio]
MMRREDEDEEEEEEDTDKVKVLDVDGTILRDYFTPGVEGEVPLASYVRAPTRRCLITGGNAAGEALLLTLKPEVIRSVTQTYEACQALFREHDLHNLNPRGRAM